MTDMKEVTNLKINPIHDNDNIVLIDITQIPEIRVINSDDFAITGPLGYTIIAFLQFLLGAYFCNIYKTNIREPFTQSMNLMAKLIITILAILEFKKGNTINVHSFLGYSAFFQIVGETGLREKYDPNGMLKEVDEATEKAFFVQMATFYFLFMIYFLFMTVGALKTSYVLVSGFFFQVFALILLSASYWKWEFLDQIDKASGAFMIISAFCILYYATAGVINIGFGKRIVPVFYFNEKMGEKIE